MQTNPIRPRVTFETSHGSFVLELDRGSSPETVENFLTYVRDGFYEGTIFHRVIAGFMIQGGGFTPELRQSQTRAPIRNEADRGGKNDRGSIAMARTSDPHSATRAVLHQRRRQRFPESPRSHRTGLGLCGLRARRRRHGYGGSDRRGGDRFARNVPGRAGGNGRHPEDPDTPGRLTGGRRPRLPAHVAVLAPPRPGHRRP